MSEQPLLVVFPRGQLSPKDKERMTKAGILAVEADSPKDVVQLHLAQPLIQTGISGDAIVRAALKAIAIQPRENNAGFITDAGRAAHSFVKLVSESLEATP